MLVFGVDQFLTDLIMIEFELTLVFLLSFGHFGFDLLLKVGLNFLEFGLEFVEVFEVLGCRVCKFVSG